jgi:hypothetical protein
MKENINIKVRSYLRANPHFTDDIVAEKFNISLASVSANKSHITMGTDTDNPQVKSKSKLRTFRKVLTLIKTKSYELSINDEGQYSRSDLIGKRMSNITDIEFESYDW